MTQEIDNIDKNLTEKLAICSPIIGKKRKTTENYSDFYQPGVETSKIQPPIPIQPPKTSSSAQVQTYLSFESDRKMLAQQAYIDTIVHSVTTNALTNVFEDVALRQQKIVDDLNATKFVNNWSYLREDEDKLFCTLCEHSVPKNDKNKKYRRRNFEEHFSRPKHANALRGPFFDDFEYPQNDFFIDFRTFFGTISRNP